MFASSAKGERRDIIGTVETVCACSCFRSECIFAVSSDSHTARFEVFSFITCKALSEMVGCTSSGREHENRGNLLLKHLTVLAMCSKVQMKIPEISVALQKSSWDYQFCTYPNDKSSVGPAFGCLSHKNQCAVLKLDI